MPAQGDPAELEWCEIHHWRGYVTATFYAATDAGEVLAESEPFRWRKAGSPAPTPAALAAYCAVAAAVSADGWTVAGGNPSTWYGTRFSRSVRLAPAQQTAPAPTEVAVATRPEKPA